MKNAGIFKKETNGQFCSGPTLSTNNHYEPTNVLMGTFPPVDLLNKKLKPKKYKLKSNNEKKKTTTLKLKAKH